MRILSFVGFAGAGKDSCSDHLCRRFGYRKIAFADALKDACAAIFCWDRALLEGSTVESRLWREQVDPWWAKRLGLPDFTPRWALRNFGTEVVRHLHADIWLNNVAWRLEQMAPDCVGAIFSDARFSNEFTMIRQHGGQIVRIRRGPEPSWMPLAQAASQGDAVSALRLREEFNVHESEWRWVALAIDGLIENDADLPTLYHKAEKAVGY